MEKLNGKALAISMGVLWSLFMLCVGWTSWLFHWGNKFVGVMSSVYIWFRPTFFGGIVGAIWGFFDAAIAGLIIAWIYNMVAEKK